MTVQLDAGERLGRDELEALQLTRLRATLRHAYENVSFYRESFDAAGLRPDDCRSLADLARFPLTAKSDLRDNYPFGMFAVDQADVRRVHASSGTTGRPTVVGYTQGDLDTWADVVACSIRRPAAGPVTRSMWRTDTACSPAVWARTTGPSGSAAPSSPRPAA